LSDLRLLSLAKRYESCRQTKPEFTTSIISENLTGTATASARTVALLYGAHMQGLPLNRQLLDLDARFLAATRTSPNYRLYALTTAPPERPRLIRDEAQGKFIDLELWELPKENLADFIKSPLCIGSVEMEDGQWE
jgi:allophanate hydrolase